jgi:uncharacterized protein YbaR (Trm112 family)
VGEANRYEDERRRTVSVDAPRFVCPACRSSLEHHPAPDEHYSCPSCARSFPVVIGIPDFRLLPDPWIDREADRAKGLALEADTLDTDFESTVRAYWERTPDTPRALAERFTRYVVEAEPRANEWLARVAPNASGNAAGPRGDASWVARHRYRHRLPLARRRAPSPPARRLFGAARLL